MGLNTNYTRASHSLTNSKKKLEKLQVWNNDISNAYKEMKQTNIKWYNAWKPSTSRT